MEDLVKFIAENGSNKVNVEVNSEDATSDLPKAAAAATESASGVAEAVKSAASQAAEAVEAAVGSGEGEDIHDEL